MIVILNIRTLLSYIIKLLTLSKYGLLDYTSEIGRMDINCTAKDNKWATMKRAVQVWVIEPGSMRGKKMSKL